MLRKVKINQKIYESNKTRDVLEGEFTEFIIKKYNIDEFFDLYQQLFYEIPKQGINSHNTILAKSTEYAGTPPNPKDQEILDLEAQIREVQFEIDSIEDVHPFIPNDTSVIQARNEPSLRYLIQSGKKRQIKSDEVFDLLKTRTGYAKDIPNEDFCILLNSDAIAGITPGPDINSQEDLNVDIAFVNTTTPGTDSRYAKRGINQILDEIKIMVMNPDLRVNPTLPEGPDYDPMANIEEPPPTSKALELNPIMNTNDFNKSNASFNTYRSNSSL